MPLLFYHLRRTSAAPDVDKSPPFRLTITPASRALIGDCIEMLDLMVTAELEGEQVTEAGLPACGTENVLLITSNASCPEGDDMQDAAPLADSTHRREGRASFQ
jgi:hypothetical protein